MSFDDRRATAIIERAIQHGWYTSDKMPQGEGERAILAEEFVQMAKQTAGVRKVWIDNSGGLEGKALEAFVLEKLPGWPEALDILFEADVTVGTNGTSNPPSASSGTDEEPSGQPGHQESAPLPAAPSTEEGGDASDAVTTQSGEAQQREPHAIEPQPVAEAGASNAEAASVATDLPAMTGVAVSAGTIYVEGEVWESERGEQWRIERTSDGGQIEATKVETGETTLVPAGFLKRLVQGVDRAPEEPPIPQHEQQELPNAPSAPESVAYMEEGESSEPAQSAPASKTPLPEGTFTLSGPGGKSGPIPFDASMAQIAPEAAKAGLFLSSTAPLDHDDEGDEAYQRILDDTARRFAPSGMPIPHDLVDPPSMIDMEQLYDLSDKQAQELHSRMNAAAARARYLGDVESARARACDLLRKLNLPRAKREARTKLGDKVTITELKDYAEEFDQQVAIWGERAERHREEAEAYKTLFGIYSENVKVCSRDWSFRMREMHP